MTNDSPQKPKITFSTQAAQAQPQQHAFEQSYHQQYVPHVAPAPTPAAAAPRQGFFRRNALPLAFAMVFFLTFALGIMTALVFMGDVRYVQAPATTPQQPSLQTSVAAGLTRDVTRAEAPNLLEVTTATPSPSGQLDQQSADLAAAVLLGLTPKRTVGTLTESEIKQKAAEANAILHNNKLRMLREGVLAGIYSIESIEDNGQRRIQLKTVNAKLTQDHLENLLRKAADEGRITIPASLSTAGGDFDMDTMLFNLIQTSLANDGTIEGAAAAREMSRRAFAASHAKTREVGGERIYVVQSGDSLAYISLQFYGRPSAFDRIFEANRDVLTSPDRIQIGQRLKIPS